MFYNHSDSWTSATSRGSVYVQVTLHDDLSSCFLPFFVSCYLWWPRSQLRKHRVSSYVFTLPHGRSKRDNAYLWNGTASLVQMYNECYAAELNRYFDIQVKLFPCLAKAHAMKMYPALN